MDTGTVMGATVTGESVVCPKMGAAVVGWFVGFLDGPVVKVGVPVAKRPTDG